MAQTDTLMCSSLYPYYFDFGYLAAVFRCCYILNADFKPAEPIRHCLNDVIIYKVK